MRLAINGLGRIGRLALRQALLRPGIEVVAVNDLMEPRVAAHLVAFDSVHGPAPFPVSFEADALIAAGRRIPISRIPEARPFPEADIVLECTGQHRGAGQLNPFLDGPTRHVLVSGCAEAAVLTVPGLDEADAPLLQLGDPGLAPLALLCRVLEDAFGLESVLATSLHGYLGDQKILDLPHRNLRLARAAHASMIPFPAPATAAQLATVLPHLAQNLQVLEVRVPTPDVGMVEVNACLRLPATPAALEGAFRAAASGTLAGNLAVLAEERVSADLVGHPASCAFDPFLTRHLSPTFVKVLAWHDHEWAGAARLLDLAQRLGGRP